LNLVRNAADAMDSVSGRPRVLHVKSAIYDLESVLVSVEDSGTGIDLTHFFCRVGKVGLIQIERLSHGAALTAAREHPPLIVKRDGSKEQKGTR
jgi:hypothetical protein